MKKRTPARQKAIELAKYLRKEQLDYTYLKEVFRYLRKELEIKVTVERKEQKEVYIPTEEEIQKYYQAVWQSKDTQNMVIIKTLLYTGIRVGELIRVKINESEKFEENEHDHKNEYRIVRAHRLINGLISELLDPNLFYSRLSFLESTKDALDIKG